MWVELEGGHTTMTELGRETRKCDPMLARSEKIETALQPLDVRVDWHGKVYVKKTSSQNQKPRCNDFISLDFVAIKTNRRALNIFNV